jgi:hypothetical protein
MDLPHGSKKIREAANSLLEIFEQLLMDMIRENRGILPGYS